MIETIYEDAKKNISITIDKSYNQKFLEIAGSTLWGTEGIVYKMNNLAIEFDKFKDPIFVTLKKNDELASTCILNHKQVCMGNSVYDAFYLCILSVSPDKMNKGYGTLIVNKATEYIFDKFDKVIVYAYVEEDNQRSKKVFKKSNYTYISTFLAPSNVSLKPKLNINVFKLEKEDKDQIIGLINKQYDNHSFVDIEGSFDAESYYIIKENNEIKAGLQVKILSWSFISLSGFEGFLMMKVVPKLPFLKKIFNPRNHSFLKIGNIYIADNLCFSKLLNSVMFENKLNTSLVYVNPNSKVDVLIIEEMRKGVLSSIDSKVMMFYKAKNIPLNEIEKPQFLSLADSI